MPNHQLGVADSLLEALRSPDADARIHALHSICPCRASVAVYERYMDEVKLLHKDPNPRVRKVALHLDEDAGHVEMMLARLDLAEERGARFGDSTFTAHWRRQRKRHPA